MVCYLISTGPTDATVKLSGSLSWSIRALFFHDLGWKYLDRLS